MEKVFGLGRNSRIVLVKMMCNAGLKSNSKPGAPVVPQWSFFRPIGVEKMDRLIQNFSVTKTLPFRVSPAEVELSFEQF